MWQVGADRLKLDTTGAHTFVSSISASTTNYVVIQEWIKFELAIWSIMDFHEISVGIVCSLECDLPPMVWRIISGSDHLFDYDYDYDYDYETSLPYFGVKLREWEGQRVDSGSRLSIVDYRYWLSIIDIDFPEALH